MDSPLCLRSSHTFLQHHHIELSTSSPHFPRSNGFNECHVQTLKTALSIGQDSHKTLENILLDLWSTPTGPNMPSPCKILHNRTLQHPGKPGQPVDMESVRNYLLSCRQSHKMYFNRAHGIHDLTEVGLGQEVLFRSPVKDEYIPRAIFKQATAPHSYTVEAQGKSYDRTRKHVWPIHLNIPSPAQPQPQPPKQKKSLPSHASLSPTLKANTLQAISHYQVHLQSPPLHSPSSKATHCPSP